MQHDFILLDRSGSMASLWVEAINSINGYVKKLADDKVDTGVTLVAFDLDGATPTFETVRDRIIPTTWKPVDVNEIGPRGMTPLNDAAVKIVSLAKAGNYEKVAIIIMTDGHENASKEFTAVQAKKMLDDCRARGWQVIFLGANFDNAAQAAQYGNKFSNTMQVSAQNLGVAMAATGDLRARYASTGEDMDYSDDLKEKMKAQ